MKFLLFIAILIGFCLSPVFGQFESDFKKNNLRIGIGSSFLGTGDLRAFNFYTEYNRRLNKYLSIGPAFNIAQVSVNEEMQRSIYVAYNLDAMLYVSPLTNVKKADLRVGGGISVRYNISQLIVEAIINAVRVIEYYGVTKDWQRGYTLALAGDVDINEHLFLGFKGLGQIYGDDDLVWLFSVNFGVKF